MGAAGRLRRFAPLRNARADKPPVAPRETLELPDTLSYLIADRSYSPANGN